MALSLENTITIGFLNIHGQSGLPVTKQKQIEDFIRRNNLDILNCQEINIEEEKFSQCNFLSSNYTVISNNAQKKYGTATIYKNNFSVENFKLDTQGRGIFYNIENLTIGNVYLHSGTDGNSRGAREQYCSETIPQLLVNCKDSGLCGGDLNCIINSQDCTNNPESKKSPSLARLVRTFSQVDSYRTLHPNGQAFSRYYTSNGNSGASRIDRCYQWGNISSLSVDYLSVAFSDHLGLVVKVSLPGLDKINSPSSRPLFKTSPEVIFDRVFKERLVREMEGRGR